MRIRRVGGTHTYKTPLVQPGAYFDLELKLAPGRYKLWCSIANHEALGMKAMLTVRAVVERCPERPPPSGAPGARIAPRA